MFIIIRWFFLNLFFGFYRFNFIRIIVVRIRISSLLFQDFKIFFGCSISFSLIEFFYLN